MHLRFTSCYSHHVTFVPDVSEAVEKFTVYERHFVAENDTFLLLHPRRNLFREQFIWKNKIDLVLHLLRVTSGCVRSDDPQSVHEYRRLHFYNTLLGVSRSNACCGHQADNHLPLSQ